LKSKSPNKDSHIKAQYEHIHNEETNLKLVEIILWKNKEIEEGRKEISK